MTNLALVGQSAPEGQVISQGRASRTQTPGAEGQGEEGQAAEGQAARAINRGPVMGMGMGTAMGTA
ncbi:MAG: hypothetical protein OXF76_15200 [Caldilineaceae bacterium]|nr:hypothetical protein [Caldilineaceae bacterium]